ncbi:von Willebrand factor type A domain-containing protein [Streptomyces sp. NBC_01795]|uniref:vWA domain-containing protein n=1 Tax=Streptomyces sp. NBC_01795 TaxID=2975943 RepID=UPI002DDABFDD|nr:von Willebrand factor type A domain-containing protein [Streptomyces sp. NBC_01795]WSA94610.1 von Willebrand factor type A domain-containing protein [Streptomyces sp. NBC_01795]
MRRGRSRWAAGALAAGLLAGCTGGSQEATDMADDSAKGGGAGAPAPGYQRGEDGGTPGAKPTEPADFRSTFALDVDTASYSYARRTLKDGALPAPGTVRTEEFVNSFPQGYKRPDNDGFAVSADGARTGDGWSLMRVGLATKADNPDAKRRPAALTFVLDVSGSMAGEGRLDLVKGALKKAAGKLRSQDSVSLVTFSGDAETVLPMTRMGDGGRKRLRDAVGELKPQASTNLGAGMKEGYRQASEHRQAGATNRVVLLSDALANTGETNAKEILRSVASHRKEQGISLFGVGVGSDYGDALMEKLTNKGDGHTVYMSTMSEAQEIFVNQLPRNIDLRARDAKAQVVFDRDTVDSFRLLGYEDRKVADDDFRDDRVDGGEIGPGHTVTALYAVRLNKGAQGPAATARVRWLDPDNRKPHEESRTVGVGALTGGSLWTKRTGGDADRDADGEVSEEAAEGQGKVPSRLRLAAVAAYFADALRTRPDGTRPESTPPESTPPGSIGPDGEPEPAAKEQDTPSRLPGAPSLSDLRTEARRLAKETGLRSADRLATDIGRAERLDGRDETYRPEE